MRDPARIDRILARLRAYWMDCPDLRLGQIVVNATPHRDPSRVFSVDDEVLYARLVRHDADCDSLATEDAACNCERTSGAVPLPVLATLDNSASLGPGLFARLAECERRIAALEAPRQSGITEDDLRDLEQEDLP